jgi:hypothetical protein
MNGLAANADLVAKELHLIAHVHIVPDAELGYVNAASVLRKRNHKALIA